MLEIRLDGGRTAFAPGESVRGSVHWMGDATPEALDVRLLWYTRGRGDRDVGVARQLHIEAPASGHVPFEFEAPAGPYSCSGKLVSICWALDAVSSPAKDVARTELVLGPGGSEVELGRTVA
jgi:hypothetical protein